MRQSDCRVQIRHVNRYVSVVPFDNALMLLRERMGSKKLLLKQREVAEAFASGRDTVVSLPTSYGKNFCCHGYISTA